MARRPEEKKKTDETNRIESLAFREILTFPAYARGKMGEGGGVVFSSVLSIKSIYSHGPPSLHIA